MKYTELESILDNSTKIDWISNDETGDFTYKNDVNLRIERRNVDREYKMGWSDNLPDPSTALYEYVVKYNNSYIKTYLLVSVDGARVTLPVPTRLPNSELLYVEKRKVNFSKIVDMGVNDLVNEYIYRCKFTVVDRIPWEDSGE